MKKLLDLTMALPFEVKRRKKLLGPLCVLPEFEYKEFRRRSLLTGVPVTILNQWYIAYRKGGKKALKPEHWLPLDEKQRRLISERFTIIRDFADLVEIDMKQAVQAVAEQNQLSLSSASRWLRRYRIGGLWGLLGPHNPLKSERPVKTPPKLDMGGLDEKTLEIIYQRREMLGELATLVAVTDAAVKKRAEEVGVSPRTLWNYLRAYRQYGQPGLAPKKRKSEVKVSQLIEDAVVALRMRHPKMTRSEIHRRSSHLAQQMGETIPSLWQVQQICKKISKSELLLGAKENNKFRNSYQITYPIRFSGVVYQIDHTLVDVLVRDMRRPEYRTEDGTVRMWLTICLDSNSRCIVAYRFAYDQPNRHTVAGVIRDSILNSPGGIPDEIWVDNGKDLIANHVQELTRELGIHLEIGTPGQPQHRGRVERLFGTLNTRLWSMCDGYTGSNVVERPSHIKVTLTPNDLVKKLERFRDVYHNEIHSSLGVTPLDYWRENCFAPPVAGIRQLDMLLLESKRCTVQKDGIAFKTKKYWHPDLAPLVREKVLIRADTRYEAPEEIEVFHDGQWICTAFDQNSERGRRVTDADIGRAKKQQRRQANENIKQKKHALKTMERSVGETGSDNEVIDDFLEDNDCDELDSHMMLRDDDSQADVFNFMRGNRT